MWRTAFKCGAKVSLLSILYNILSKGTRMVRNVHARCYWCCCMENSRPDHWFFLYPHPIKEILKFTCDVKVFCNANTFVGCDALFSCLNLLRDSLVYLGMWTKKLLGVLIGLDFWPAISKTTLCAFFLNPELPHWSLTRLLGDLFRNSDGASYPS